MHFIGCDLHKQTVTLNVVNQDRQTLASRRFSCSDPEGILQWCRQFLPFALVVEATASYEWFVQLVEPSAERVVLAHPGKLRIIAESTRKSDELDAKVLAEFLALDMIPEAHRPSPRQRAHRNLVRQRYYLRKRATSVKNRIRRILGNYNADFPGLFGGGSHCADPVVEGARLSHRTDRRDRKRDSQVGGLGPDPRGPGPQALAHHPRRG